MLTFASPNLGVATEGQPKTLTVGIFFSSVSLKIERHGNENMYSMWQRKANS